MPTYEEALARLERFANYEINRSVVYTSGTFELQRMYDLLARLGNPHQAYPTIHIAGSKGKGSTAAMSESILRAAGYRTGLYISPHLHSFGERMQIDGAPISAEDFAALVDALAPHAEAVAGITWFEVITALAFLHFARRRVDVAVIEVGLGGRLDATNVITPAVSVITSLSYEHMAWLGDTLAKIAFEKAGIIKPGVPVDCAPQEADALAVIERVCAERAAPLLLVGREWQAHPGPIHAGGQSFAAADVRSDDFSRRSDAAAAEAATTSRAWTRFDLPLLGRHQIVNAVCALAAVGQAAAAGLALPPAALHAGLRAVQWPGRGEVLSSDPLVVADGAHNGDSARKLVEMLAEWFPGRRWAFVVGTLSDKDHVAILRELAPHAAQLFLTRSHSGRATDPALLAALARQFGGEISPAASVAEALTGALATGHAVCLTGSLSIAAEAREAWAERLRNPSFDASRASC
ncbi:MAG: dihydrofolate synthase / folylpolyglutamate synthase [Chloroflexota bacterium]|nr:dihydrofolate synthase / folylpolyglutamate synthase [Chloroflexota bacterium]